VPYGTGEGISENNRMPGKLQVNGIVTNGCLTMSFSYDDQWVTEAEAERLKKNFQQHLEAIIIHSVQQEKVVKTPSDFSYKNLTMNQLKELTSDEAIEDILPLTPMQAGMFYHYKKDIKTTSYVIQNEFVAKEDIDLKNFHRALKLLQKKHEILRITITDEMLDAVMQIIWEEMETNFEKVDPNRNWQQVLENDLVEGFDLRTGPLFRVKIQENRGNNRILISFHHIILDGWSTAIVYQDLIYFYNKLCQGIRKEVLVAEFQKDGKGSYQDYVQWLLAQDEQQGLDNWKNLLANYDDVSEIRQIELISDESTNKIDRIAKSCSTDLNRKLEKQLNSLGVTHSTLMEMAWGILLQNYSNNKDIVFGKVVSGREAPVHGIEQIAGLFISTVPVRVKVEACNLAELVTNLQKQSSSVSYSANSLTDIQEYCEFHPDFIKTIVVFENYYVKDHSVEEGNGIGLQWEMVNGREETNYGLTLSSYLGKEDKLSFDISYQTSKYGAAEIERMLLQLELILTQFALDPLMMVSELTRTISEEQGVISAINQTRAKYPSKDNVTTIFESIVKTFPHKEAVIFGEESWNYSELNRRGNQVAHRLVALGIEPGEAVGIVAERS
ncbi:condensation domain-containing protein, partial [Listeria monocytogenes]|uniref:condensation domain-containing protein n=2 Tax=Listeria TaxID=1637 RepID=UPI00117A84DE